MIRAGTRLSYFAYGDKIEKTATRAHQESSWEKTHSCTLPLLDSTSPETTTKTLPLLFLSLLSSSSSKASKLPCSWICSNLGRHSRRKKQKNLINELPFPYLFINRDLNYEFYPQMSTKTSWSIQNSAPEFKKTLQKRCSFISLLRFITDICH